MSEQFVKQFIDWKPMTEDFESITFNSYGSGQTAAHIPFNLLPQSSAKEKKSGQTFKLYIDGFPSDLTESGLKNFLNGIDCQFLKVKIIPNKDLLNRPFGFIDFESRKCAENGIQLIKSQKYFKLFVCFMATETDIRLKSEKINKEFKDFMERLRKQNEELRANGEIEDIPDWDPMPTIFLRQNNLRLRRESHI